MSAVEQKINELEQLTQTAEFQALPPEERRRILDDYYRRELAPASVDRASFDRIFAAAWQAPPPPKAASERKQLNLTPVWLTLGLVGVTAVALTGLVFWTNNLQDISTQDDATLIKSLRGGDPVREDEVALRRSLPDTGPEVWEIEKALERIAEPIKDGGWLEAKERTARVVDLLNRYEPQILSRVPAGARAPAVQAIAQVRSNIRTLEDKIQAKDITGSTLQARRTFWYLDLLELALLDEFRPEVPAEYRNLPRLEGGWAMVRFTTDRGPFVALVDGFNAPVTAGNFLDLVQRGFYNGLKITRAERFNLVQTGDPSGKGTGGFTDPATGKLRTIPMEVRPARKEAEITASQVIQRRVDYVQDRFELDPIKLRAEMGNLHKRYIADDWKAVPYGKTIQSYPALYYGPPGVFSMARYEKDPNSASSQFFISFSDPELNPTGKNLSDGKYANFGYITQGIRTVRQLKVGDTIQKAEILNCKAAAFNEYRELPPAGSSMYATREGPATNLETSCLPLPAPRLVSGR
ncbi:MAG: peptidylprolyl isomerase [Aphanocapsa lilacina HA4352-LM1]|jgi:peptidylprolyl isomerase|nr:peptidylprolyl isomerase [Aphanocapsa lilacina HA4352-LM1]